MTEILSGIFILAGTIFILLSALGIIRMPDLYTRMSATTKASTLGIGLVLTGTVLFPRRRHHHLSLSDRPRRRAHHRSRSVEPGREALVQGRVRKIVQESEKKGQEGLMIWWGMKKQS